MDLQYQIRHSSFRSSKFEYKFINPKTIVLALGKSYKLSSETISVYNNLILDLISFLFTNSASNIISIDEIKTTCLSAVNRPFSLDLIPFTNREYHEEMSDESYKDSYDIKTLQRNNLYRFLLSTQGKVIELDVLKAETDKLSSSTNKKLKNEQALEYLRCLLQVFSSYIIMLIYKKCVELDAAVVKTEDFFKLLLEDESLGDFVNKSESKKNHKRESSYSSKRNTIQISELISKSEIQDDPAEETLSESEKRMAQVDLEKKKTITKPRKIAEEEAEDIPIHNLKKQASESSTLNDDKKKGVKKMEARVEVPKLRGVDNGFTENERKNIQSLLDFLDTDPDTVLGAPKVAVSDPVKNLKDKDNKESLVRKSFKVFTNIKSNTITKKDRAKNLEDLKKDAEIFTSEDSFESKFVKKDFPKPAERSKALVQPEPKESVVKDLKEQQSKILTPRKASFKVMNSNRNSVGEENVDEIELAIVDPYYPSVKTRNNSSFTGKNKSNSNSIDRNEPTSPIADPSLAIPDFLRNSRSNTGNRSSMMIDKSNPAHIPISPRLTAFDERPKTVVPIKKEISEIIPAESDDTKPIYKQLDGSRSLTSSKKDLFADPTLKERTEGQFDAQSKENIVEKQEQRISAPPSNERHISINNEQRASVPTERQTSIINESGMSRQSSMQVESNSRAIEMLLEQNTKLHQEVEDAKKQIALLQQTKIKYDYVVTKAYKKVKEIMAENQELKTELTKTQVELGTLSSKLEAIQSVFGGAIQTPISPQHSASRSITTAANLRLKEKLSASERSLQQSAKDS